jgi:hypothetical protein
VLRKYGIIRLLKMFVKSANAIMETMVVVLTAMKRKTHLRPHDQGTSSPPPGKWHLGLAHGIARLLGRFPGPGNAMKIRVTEDDVGAANAAVSLPMISRKVTRNGSWHPLTSL